MRVFLVNPSHVSFGTAVITRGGCTCSPPPRRASGAIPSCATKRSTRLTPTSSCPATSSASASTPAMRWTATGRQGGARARRLRGIWRHPRHALPDGSARARRRARRRPRRRRQHLGHGHRGLRAGRAEDRSTRRDGSPAKSSRPPAGICCRPTATCGHRFRPCAAAPSTARSARCGGPTARSRGNRRSIRSSVKPWSCAGAASGSSRWPTTTSIRSRWPTSPRRNGATMRRGCASSKRSAPSASR